MSDAFFNCLCLQPREKATEIPFPNASLPGAPPKEQQKPVVVVPAKPNWTKDKAAYDKAAYDKAAYNKESWTKEKPAGKEGYSKLPSLGVNHLCANYRGTPLKLLCLHGLGGSAATFDIQLAQFKEYTGALLELVTVDAPTPCNSEKAGAGSFQWFATSDSKAEWDASWAASLATLEEAIATHGPFDGLLGFSMGACLAPILLAHVPPGTFRFVVACCAYLPGKGDEAATLRKLLADAQPIDVPALFTIGAADTATPGFLTQQVIEFFGSATEVHHPGGHDLPRDEPALREMIAFLLKQQNKSRGGGELML